LGGKLGVGQLAQVTLLYWIFNPLRHQPVPGCWTDHNPAGELGCPGHPPN